VSAALRFDLLRRVREELDAHGECAEATVQYHVLTVEWRFAARVPAEVVDEARRLAQSTRAVG
jgi:hypothetical protein